MDDDVSVLKTRISTANVDFSCHVLIHRPHKNIAPTFSFMTTLLYISLFLPIIFHHSYAVC
jgi:hypothetical protein